MCSVSVDGAWEHRVRGVFKSHAETIIKATIKQRQSQTVTDSHRQSQTITDLLPCFSDNTGFDLGSHEAFYNSGEITYIPRGHCVPIWCYLHRALAVSMIRTLRVTVARVNRISHEMWEQWVRCVFS